MDNFGKELFQTNLSLTTYLKETDNIENGIYFIVIKSNNGVYATQKVIVNR
ncbi:MAG: T9SS type A sorting domain-containing protein [Crocinitomicaceae bacterium]|nr:T9SS type A sorting domain-containing protein [Crocinitomicaceae bacterium]